MSEALNKEQIKAKKDKEALAAMKSARDNMSTAIQRVERLEGCIVSLGDLINDMMKHIHTESYTYDAKTTWRDKFEATRKSAMQWVNG